MDVKVTDTFVAVKPAVRFTENEVNQKQHYLWGLPLQTWQKRAFEKAGASCAKNNAQTQDNPQIVMNGDWVLSSVLNKAFVQSVNTALVVNGEVIGVSGGKSSGDIAIDDLIGMQASHDILSRHNLIAKTPTDLAGSYNKTLRKTEPPYALNVMRTPAKDIMQRQFDSSYKGITDFVTKYFWPKPAFYVTRACAAMKLTPNIVTTLSLILCIAAFCFFYNGQWTAGFVTGWLMTFLDTVDGKLARTTMTYSWWGNIYDHGIDLIHPPFWYYAWFVGLGGVLAWPNAMTVALALIFTGYVVDRVIEGIFIAQHGFHIHVWRPFNSALRVYTARRNPNTFLFMLAMILMIVMPSAGVWGFYAVAAWTWICILINIVVVMKALVAPKPVVSWMEPR